MTLLNCGLCDSRKRLTRLVTEIREIADDKNLRMPCDAHVRLDDYAACAIELRARFLREDDAERRREHAGGPKHRARGNDFIVIADVNGDAVGADVGDHRSGSDGHAE